MAHIEHLVTDLASKQTFGCLDGETLLGAAIRSGRQIIRVGCRAGGCGMCKVRILGGRYETGKMSRAHVSEAEESKGFVLACRTMPSSAIEFRSKVD
ncbi:MAG: 2Fe-2S iron-sulfur cluster-binding protein [Novosphingobium sp.]